MNRSFVLKGIVLPLACAVVIGICIYFTVSLNASKLSPVIESAPLAYHDSLSSPKEQVRDESKSRVSNSVFGTISSEGEIALLYDSDYSSLIDYATVKPCSAELGETGCVYVNISEINMAKISTSKPLVITAEDMEYTFSYQGEKLVKSENEALNLAPGFEKSLVIYYRVSRGIGVTNDYYALIYKEVG